MSPRVRRSSGEAKEAILSAAEKRLIEFGVDGVRVQDIAADVGIVPATVLHHFGSREELLEELLNHGAKQLATRLDDLVGKPDVDLSSLAVELVDLYESKGYALLYSSLERGGSRSKSRTRTPIFGALLEKLVKARAARGARTREELAFVLLALNLTAFAEGSAGDAIRRGLGLPEGQEHRVRFARWLANALDPEATGTRS